MFDSFLDPAILCFFLGIAATLIKSDLEVPSPLPRLFSLYLLLAIGLKGGFELAHTGLQAQGFAVLGMALAASALVPWLAFPLLAKRVGRKNAAAIAAAYGSVSAVTFITGVSWLETSNTPFSGYMVAALAVMESPAIVSGMLLSKKRGEDKQGFREAVREALTNGSVVLLLGALLIGWISGEKGAKSLEVFTGPLFKGVLLLFLLDMGLVAARRFGGLKKRASFLLAFGFLFPLSIGLLGLLSGKLLGLPPGDLLLWCLLCGSGSYIAVPAAMRLAVPKADPSLYITLPLAITFPFNILLGIPLYDFLIQSLA